MSASTDTSIMPASTHAHNSPPRRLTEIISLDAQSNASSASADVGGIDPELEYHAEQHDRISTLRNFVQRWRETSVKTKDSKPSEDDVKKAKAEQSALTIPLGARFTDSQPDFTKSMKKRISQRTDATQAFILAEKVNLKFYGVFFNVADTDVSPLMIHRRLMIAKFGLQVHLRGWHPRLRRKEGLAVTFHLDGSYGHRLFRIMNPHLNGSKRNLRVMKTHPIWPTLSSAHLQMMKQSPHQVCSCYKLCPKSGMRICSVQSNYSIFSPTGAHISLA
jgi:hypothetical protein